MLRKNPHQSMSHISDEELVRSADGELSPQRSAAVASHLEGCWDCRARMAEIQATMTDFVRAHHAALDTQIPPITGSRALLRTRLNEVAPESRSAWWKRVPQLRLSMPLSVAVGLSLIAIAIGILWFRHGSPGPIALLSDTEATPNHSLTPGATRQVTVSEVCAVSQEEVVGDVSASLRQRVLQEYGKDNARPGDYEIDYLIAPRLGGTEDIHNLWPEPYRAREWNAYVKDALEERLHQMVCSGQLDLQTAQHDIATDWIAAYKKYFHTSKPLALSS